MKRGFPIFTAKQSLTPYGSRTLIDFILVQKERADEGKIKESTIPNYYKMQHPKKKLGLPLSVLDPVIVNVDGSPRQSMQNSLDLAQHAERWGYKHFWLAEHHNTRGIASTTTSVLIGFIATGTSTIRVGSGGVMLPNHAPLVIAEQFGTREPLYPGRIDLGLGPTPRTDINTAMALRRNLEGLEENFPNRVLR